MIRVPTTPPEKSLAVAIASRAVYAVNYDTIHKGDHRVGRC
jgi:hypothetical protein